MKIGVVADTHSGVFPEKMLLDFKKVEFIVHAGDFCTMEDAKRLSRIKDLKAVYGNMDDEYVRRKFPRKEILEVKSVRIGVFHGAGPRMTILDNVRTEFIDDKVDCIVFGHSHQPFNKKIGKILYFNPGSPNDIISAPYCSYGILDVSDRKIMGKLVKVKII